MSALDWVAVALLGGAGALTRVAVDLFSARHLTRVLSGPGPALTIGTFAVNISGAFLLGLLDGLALSPHAALLIGTAALGAYTTFSTWMLQSSLLSADGLRREAVLNLLASVAVGLGAIALGHAIGTLL